MEEGFSLIFFSFVPLSRHRGPRQLQRPLVRDDRPQKKSSFIIIHKETSVYRPAMVYFQESIPRKVFT